MRLSLLLSLLSACIVSSSAASTLPAPKRTVRGSTSSRYAATTLRSSDSRNLSADRTLQRRVPGAAGIIKNEITNNPPTQFEEGPDPSLPTKILTKSGTTFYESPYGIYVQPSDGSATYTVIDGDKVYLRNIWSISSNSGWLVGSIKDNKATFEFPQLMEVYKSYDMALYDYAVLANEITVEENGETFQTFETAESQTITFSIGADGVWTNDSPDCLIGQYAYENFAGENEEPDMEWYWLGGGDLIETLTPLDVAPVEVPAGVEMESWVLLADRNGYNVKVGFDGDQCYIEGIGIIAGDGLADKVIKGTVKDGKVSFNSGQYLGILDDVRYTMFFQGGEIKEAVDEYGDRYYEYYYDKDLVFDYDPEKKTLASAGGYALTPTADYDDLYFDIVDSPELKYVSPDAEIASLFAPGFYAYWAKDESYPAEVDFSFGNVSKEGIILDLSNLYFQIFLDDDIYTFDPADYPCNSESTDELPIGISDDTTNPDILPSVYMLNGVQYCCIYADGFEKVDVRFVYIDGDRRIYSDFTNFFDLAGVEETDIEKIQPVASSYVGLDGCSIARPEAGIYIRADRMSDGSVKYNKVIIK